MSLLFLLKKPAGFQNGKTGITFVTSTKHGSGMPTHFHLGRKENGRWRANIFNQKELSLSTLSTNRWKLKTVMSAVKP